MKTLYLYTTLGCHLCEEAELMMEPLLREKGFKLKKIEISESEKLVEQYGIRIPVIGLPGHPEHNTGEPAELGWPFDLNQLKQFLSSSS